MHKFCNLKYTTWDINLSDIPDNVFFEQELNQAFEIAESYDAPQKIGDGKSLMNSVIPNFKTFDSLYKFVVDQIQHKLEILQIHPYYRKKLFLKRVWANRIYQNTEGTIHDHPDSLVFLLYYKAPENSSEIIFINPKYQDKMLQSHDVIPEEDKLRIPTYTGMCLLHDGAILHAVGKHNNIECRDVIVFEFKSVFY